MPYETILFSVDAGIARLTLNRPEKLNNFNVVMHTDVRQALERLPAAGARVLVLTGAAWGMIWQCVDDAELASTVQTLAEQFAVAPTRGLAATKAAIRESWRHSLAEQLDIERDVQRELGRSSDYAEGVAAFAGKRTPNFLGR